MGLEPEADAPHDGPLTTHYDDSSGNRKFERSLAKGAKLHRRVRGGKLRTRNPRAHRSFQGRMRRVSGMRRRRRAPVPSTPCGIPHLAFAKVHYSLISVVVGVDAKHTTGFGQQSWSCHGP